MPKKKKLNSDSDADWGEQEIPEFTTSSDPQEQLLKNIISTATRWERTNMNDYKHDPTIISRLVNISKNGTHWIIRTGAEKAISRLKSQGVSFDGITGNEEEDVKLLVTGRTLHIRSFDRYVTKTG